MPFIRILRGLYPAPQSLKQRLARFPTEALELERPVVIRWNAHQVPFIEAETDRDLAYTLGLVHMHLRGAQISLFRMLFSGRLTEMFGPAAGEIDHFLRILDFGRAATGIEACLPEHSRVWVEAFVAGLNGYQSRATVLPPEFGLLGLRPEPFTMLDIMKGARVGSTDFTWLTQFSLLKHRMEPGFAKLWNRLLAIGGAAAPADRGGTADAAAEHLRQALLGASKPGSNAFVVAPQRSETGSALIANDPHLSLSLPNTWIIVGVRSPTYHLAGFMICGLPIFAIGRNPELAWGGTNLRASSSDLYDVGDLPPEQIRTEEVTLKARCWRPIRRTVRNTPLGPVISDAKILNASSGRPIALRWVGHDATDEFTAFLKAAVARTPEEFRAAFATYGISGQNMLFADRQGNIGQVLAVASPRRQPFPANDPVLNGADPATHWQGFDRVYDLPWVLNPPEGVLASANNKPIGDTGRIGFTYAPRDRVGRIESLLARKPRLSIDDLSVIQTDVAAPGAGVLAGRLAAIIRSAPPATVPAALLAAIETWNGDYSAESTGAAAFETFIYHVIARLHGATSAEGLPDVLGQWSMIDTFLIADLEALADADRARLLGEAAIAAMVDWRRHPKWGDMHRLRLGHVLARLPAVGKRFLIGDYPSGGSRQTPMKMSHGLVRDRHSVAFGSMARHISDLADPDANWFVLLGGQDGWLGSEQFADQMPLWRERRYIRVPLGADAVAREFPITMTLTPAAARR
jgi:penicillin amidase